MIIIMSRITTLDLETAKFLFTYNLKCTCNEPGKIHIILHSIPPSTAGVPGAVVRFLVSNHLLSFPGPSAPSIASLNPSLRVPLIPFMAPFNNICLPNSSSYPSLSPLNPSLVLLKPSIAPSNHLHWSPQPLVSFLHPSLAPFNHLSNSPHHTF